MEAPLAPRRSISRLHIGLKLPDRLAPFGDRAYHIYRVFWFAAFALALIGPVLGIYERISQAASNSDLIPGSRLGVALALDDATRIRFPVGDKAKSLGIKPGDRILALDGLPLPAKLPYTNVDREKHQDDPNYILFDNLVFGASSEPVTMSIKTVDGQVHDVNVVPGDEHIENAARSTFIGSAVLKYIDLLHVVTYPFLLVAAWFLHKRQQRDPVSCIMSLAILLTMGAEMPSASFLMNTVGVPRPIHAFLYDLGNICLLSGIILFPHGKLSFRVVALLAILPVLIFLHGDIYRGLFAFFMLCAVLLMISCLRKAEEDELRQQIKWALFGFSGYAGFLLTSFICDAVKPQAGSFSTQIILEMSAGLCLGLAFLAIQLGLLVALLRYRLYDAEFVISRSATIAVITLILGAVVAGVIQGLGTTIQNTFGENAGAGAAGIGAAMATVLISPIYDRINRWMEHRFRKKLIELKDGLPELVRDLRETVSLPELVHDVLARIREGVQTVRAAIIVDSDVEGVSGISIPEVSEWLRGFDPDPEPKLTKSSDAIFRIHVPLRAYSQEPVGWLLIGPRPDGTTLRDDEQDALVEIADPLARAIKIVIKNDAKALELSTTLAELRQRVEMLETGGMPRKLQAPI